MKRIVTILMTGFGLLLTSPSTGFACSVCMGGPPTKQTEGVGGAILGMLAMTYLIVGGMILFAIGFSRRARAAASLPENLPYRDPDDRIHS